jgi:Zn-dependent protease with chaperone function
MSRSFDTTAYRYPNEQLILALTLLLVLAVIALTATATVCLSAVFVAAMIAMAYMATRAQHQALLAQAYQVTPAKAPELAALVQRAVNTLHTDAVQVFVAPSRELNAYTFGLSSPKVVVLHAPLLQFMDADELQFILGHELGHVRLGHTWLNSLVGGMAGIPSPFFASVLLSMAFLWWNRACEYSADRAGMLVCGKPHKAISALVKLEAGPRLRSYADLERALALIERQDDDPLSSLGELLATHPMMARRIEKLRQYAASAAYRRLREQMGG